MKEYKPLDSCGAIVLGPKFFHLKKGRQSTLDGMTLEYANEMIPSLKENYKIKKITKKQDK